MRPLVVANWKMQLGDASAVETARELSEALPSGVEVVLCPAFTALARVADALRGSAIAVGAQDCAWEERGAFTGEVSPADLVALGCRSVILGHSERRQQLGETDAMVGRKIRAALTGGLRPICCVGETLDERQRGVREAVLERQLRAALSGITLVGTQQLCVAYEPVWAIGTGHAAAPEDAAGAHAFIADLLRALLGASSADRVRMLYGGSVSPENIASFLAQPNVHGVLVGTASQTVARLRDIVAAVAGGISGMESVDR